jgi:hypothetical protein
LINKEKERNTIIPSNQSFQRVSVKSAILTRLAKSAISARFVKIGHFGQFCQIGHFGHFCQIRPFRTILPNRPFWTILSKPAILDNSVKSVIFALLHFFGQTRPDFLNGKVKMTQMLRIGRFAKIFQNARFAQNGPICPK